MGHYDSAYEIEETGDISDATRLRFEQMRGETRTLEKLEDKMGIQSDAHGGWTAKATPVTVDTLIEDTMNLIAKLKLIKTDYPKVQDLVIQQLDGVIKALNLVSGK